MDALVDKKLRQITEYEEYYADTLKNKKVEVSIYCITYNHANYIKRTLEGFLMQQMSVEYEIFIFDDASNDGTSDIVREYAKKYPELVHAIIAKKNTYTYINRKETIIFLRQHVLRGKYIAVCEGDDYWIYNKKLQIQYDLMESNPNITLCCHNAIRFNEKNKEVIPQILNMDSGCISRDEVFLGNHGILPTASYFFRREYWCNVPHFFMTSPVGDDTLRHWCAYNGDIYYLDKCWCVRNYMHDGSWNYSMSSNHEVRKKHYLEYFKYLKEYNEETCDKFVEQTNRQITGMCEVILAENNVKKMTKNEYDAWTKENICDYGREYKAFFENVYKNKVRDTIDYYQDIYSDLKLLDGKKFIYGAGYLGKKILKQAIQNGVTIEGFCQTTVDVNNCTVEGLPVINIEQLLAYKEPCQVIIAIMDNTVVERIKEQLTAKSENRIDIYS